MTKNGEPQDDETAVVTPTTVSTPDMSTAGTKEITVTYTEGDVTVTDKYEINVTENVVTPGESTGNLNNVFFGCATGNNATEQSGKFDDVLVVAGCKSTAQTKTNYQSDHVRFYADSYLTLSVPAGYVIKSIVFTAGGDWKGSITASTGTYDNNTKTWTGNAQEVKFSFAQQNRIKSVKVTYAADVKYALNITTPSNGTLVVKEGSTVLTDGAQVYEGTKLVVTPTPKAGYVFESLTVGGEAVELTEEGSYTFNMPAADVTISATFKENEKPAATLTLSKNGETEDITGYKQDDKVTLPSITSDCVKAFVGWSADANCAIEPEYKAGDEYTLVETAQTLYAVYATVGGGGEATAANTLSSNGWANESKHTSLEIDENVKATITGGGNSGKYYTSGTNWRLYQNENATITISTTIGELKSVKFTFTYDKTGTLLYNGTKLISGTAVEISGTSATFTVGNSGTATNGQIRISKIEVVYTGGVSYSNYSTTCAAAPIATVTPTSVTKTASSAEGKVTVTYENVNTANVAVALYNDEACTETFTAGWLTASIDADKNITYTVAENTTYAERKAYIQLTAPETTGATDPAVVVIPVTQAAKDKVFASLEELVAANLTAGDEVTVTLNNDVIKDFYIYSSKRCGVVFDVQKDGKDIKIYFNNQTTIDDWAVGGKLSGTLTNVKWTTYSSAWQLAPANTWAWANLTYTEPKAVSTVIVSGAPTKTTYVDGEAFDPAGLTVTVNYNDATSEVNPTGVTFTVTPTTLVKGQTSVSVTATYNSVTSAAYEVTGLTVNDIPTKTVAEFIAAEGGRCYLEGIVSGLTEGNSMKYGNFDLTDASGTIYVYGCLNAAGESQKFADLGVKNGDKIKVIADEYELYGGTKDEAKNVQYVSHVSAATITITDITMEVGKTKTIAATVVPAEAEVTYTIKENAANAISLSGNVITANAVGTATITATIATAADYLGNSVDFKVTVTPESTSDEVVILAELDGKWYAMKGAVPSGKSNQLDAIEVTYFNGTLYNVPDEVKASITWTRSVVDGKATFVNNGKYLKGGTSTDLNLAGTVDNNCRWMWNDENGYYTTNTSGTIRTFLYRENYNFKNYGASQAGKEDANGNYSELPVVTTPVYATGNPVYTRTIASGDYGTICLPYGSSNYTGAEFYEISWMELDEDGTTPKSIWLDQVNGNLVAGKPYIFKATSTVLTVNCTGSAVASPVEGEAGLVGTFKLIQDSETSDDPSNTLEGNYMITGNQFLLCGTGCWLKEYRAYIDASIIANHTTKKAVIPGRRRVCLGETSENTTTSVDNNQLPNANIQKVIENGQFIIIRDGVKYNVQGVRL